MEKKPARGGSWRPDRMGCLEGARIGPAGGIQGLTGARGCLECLEGAWIGPAGGPESCLPSDDGTARPPTKPQRDLAALGRGPLAAGWRRAVALANSGKSTPSDCPPAVARAAAYLREADCGSQAALEPAIHAARQLREGGRMERAFLEARILGEQAYTDIDAVRGLVPGCAEAYSKLFFDVGPHLKAKFFILSEAVGEPALTQMTTDDFDTFARWLGYLKGPVLVGLAEEYHRDGLRLPASLQGLPAAEREALSRRLSVHALFLAKTLPFAQAHRALRLVELRRMLDESSAAASGGVLPPLSAQGEDWKDWGWWSNEVRRAAGVASAA